MPEHNPPRYIVIVIDKETGERQTKQFDEELETTHADPHGGREQSFDMSPEKMRSWVNRKAAPDKVVTVYEAVSTVTRPDDAVWEDVR